MSSRGTRGAAPIPWRFDRRGTSRAAGVLLATLLALLVGLGLWPTQSVRLGWFDLCHRLAPRARLTAPVVVVEIDDRSIAAQGQWPWPRTVLAKLVSRIAEGRPAAVGVDILMSEPDRLSPSRLADLVPGLDAELVSRLRSHPGGDAELARVLATVKAVLAVAGLDQGDRTRPPVRSAPVLIQGTDPSRLVRAFPAGLRSVDTIDAAAAGHGLVSIEPQAGAVRRIPLVAMVGQTLVPALAIELFRVADGRATFTLRGDRDGVRALTLGDLVVPTEPDGGVWLYYTPHDRGRFVSAVDVLEGRADGRTFEGTLVLLGVTATGLSDHHPTPLRQLMAGVEIQAQLVEAIFDGALLRRPRWAPAAEGALLFMAGVVLAVVTPRRRVWASLVLVVALLAGMLALGLLLFERYRILLDAASPAIGASLLCSVMLGLTLAEADRQRRALRRQVERQREAAAQVTGELEAARRIQMSILPDPAGALPDEPRFDLHAYLEPARVVGGDLYDFFMLDRDRLLFLIGDVAGKGVAGSLFMAVSKALYKTTVLRHGADVGEMMREANREISRDNRESLFVAVFAGVLDGQTGRLDYCSAGHEDPYLLSRDGAAPSRLARGGGPPLCAAPDFAYAASQHQMRPGESLCLVTDGVIEARNSSGESYGRGRLMALLSRFGPVSSVQEIGGSIRHDVEAFAAGVEAADDIAILVVRWNGPTGSLSEEEL